MWLQRPSGRNLKSVKSRKSKSTVVRKGGQRCFCATFTNFYFNDKVNVRVIDKVGKIWYNDTVKNTKEG